MKLTTRLLRNLSFVIMLAVIPLVGEVPAFAVVCGPYFCTEGCGGQGVWMSFRGCDEGSCPGGETCTAIPPSCNELCMQCPGEGQWDCGPI